MDGNIGVLLHKLTKYQTLMSNNKISQKNSLYQQKINYYNNKLRSLGISDSNLNQLGGAFTAATYQDTLKNLIKIQTDTITAKLNSLRSGNPADVTELATRIGEVQGSVTSSKQKYDETIDILVGLIRQLIIELVKLEQEISNIALPEGFSLQSFVDQLNSIKTLLSNFGQDESIITSYLKSLDTDLGDASKSGQYIDPVKDASENITNALKVEFRQIGELIKASDARVTDDNTLKAKINELVTAGPFTHINNALNPANSNLSTYVNTLHTKLNQDVQTQVSQNSKRSVKTMLNKSALGISTDAAIGPANKATYVVTDPVTNKFILTPRLQDTLQRLAESIAKIGINKADGTRLLTDEFVNKITDNDVMTALTEKLPTITVTINGAAWA